ncbi:MAG: nucleotidyl transferase AbiEii/AbiGii toxin family protein [Terrimicrobiaceae bacterium]
MSQPSLMALTTYELPSLMAGKVHALLARPFTKGRDWYDLLWYLGSGVEPNTAMLGHALQQIPSAWCSKSGQWREALMTKVETTDWAVVRQDISRFLENSDELKMLERDTMITALNQARNGKRAG